MAEKKHKKTCTPPNRWYNEYVGGEKGNLMFDLMISLLLCVGFTAVMTLMMYQDFKNKR
jgi:uncharacterized membrane protein YidH (DUF202 family)